MLVRLVQRVSEWKMVQSLLLLCFNADLLFHFFRAQQSASQPMVDYSYQDDYSMEDMTAPDTMINFSEMPQQPNYYQCPQTAHANQQLNIGFNMSLQHNSQPGYPSHPPTTQPVRPFLLSPKTYRVQFGLSFYWPYVDNILSIVSKFLKQCTVAVLFTFWILIF